MPIQAMWCSASQSRNASRSPVIVVNLRLITRQPPSGAGIRTQATSEAFAMSSPAERCTTVRLIHGLRKYFRPRRAAIGDGPLSERIGFADSIYGKRAVE